jgi:ubiquinone/menaquinone biosynthesis C-methylase UbiE
MLIARFLRALVDEVSASGAATVLDVGCGDGFVSAKIAAAIPDASVIAVDVGAAELASHWRAHESERLRFGLGSAYDLEFPDGSFDLVCAIEVFEHLEYPGRALAEIMRVSRQQVIVTVPHEPIWRIVNLAAGRNVSRLGNAPGHINHWTRREFDRFTSVPGWKVANKSVFPWMLVSARRDGRPLRTSQSSPTP